MVDGGEVRVSVYRDGWTGELQGAIEDEGGGFRLFGPRFNGSGERVASPVLDARDADVIRGYLARAFPEEAKS